MLARGRVGLAPGPEGSVRPDRDVAPGRLRLREARSQGWAIGQECPLEFWLLSNRNSTHEFLSGERGHACHGDATITGETCAFVGSPGPPIAPRGIHRAMARSNHAARSRPWRSVASVTSPSRRRGRSSRTSAISAAATPCRGRRRDGRVPSASRRDAPVPYRAGAPPRIDPLVEPPSTRPGRLRVAPDFLQPRAAPRRRWRARRRRSAPAAPGGRGDRG